MNSPTRLDNENHPGTSACRRIFLRNAFHFTAIALSSAAFSSLRADDEPAGNQFEQQLHPVDEAPAGKWWKESWRVGWTYEHHADFSLSARARVENKDKVKWWQALFGKAAEETVGELNLEVNGISLADSGVLSKDDGEILLTRHYPRVDVNRALFRGAIGEPNILDKVLSATIDQDKRAPLIKHLFGAFGGLIGTRVGRPHIGAVLGARLGNQADGLIDSALRSVGIQVREDGGVEISPESAFLKGSAAADAANLAMQLNKEFDRRMFVIRAAEDNDHALQTRQIFDEGKDLVTLAEKSRDPGIGPRKAAEWLRNRMIAYNPPAPIVRGTLQRESFALVSDIFDAEERKPNDVWVVPATFFNSFLHPELKGEFKGNVVLRYREDAWIPSRHNREVRYHARVVEMLHRGEVDGRIRESTLEYSEPRFTAKLRSDTVGTLFVDKEDGYLRQADLSLTSDTRAGLPDMTILNGFELRGGADFRVKYDCTATPPEQAGKSE